MKELDVLHKKEHKDCNDWFQASIAWNCEHEIAEDDAFCVSCGSFSFGLLFWEDFKQRTDRTFRLSLAKEVVEAINQRSVQCTKVEGVGTLEPAECQHKWKPDSSASRVLLHRGVYSLLEWRDSEASSLCYSCCSCCCCVRISPCAVIVQLIRRRMRPLLTI